MIEYYAMESIRDLINGKYEVKTSRYEPVPFPSWNRYPCPVINKCMKGGKTECVGYVSIFIDTEKIRWIELEICFFREKKRAFIRKEHLQLKKLVELNIINISRLEVETF
jgi:hypothetical protein